MRGLIDWIGSTLLRDRRRYRFPDSLYRAGARDRRSAAVDKVGARHLRSTDGTVRRSPPTPDEVLADDPDELRTAVGLSHAKTAYLRSLAEHVLGGSLQLDQLRGLPDADVIAELTAVKGIGEWSSHMFLMFDLGRPDVLAVGDLGIRRAVMVRYALDALPDAAELAQIGEPWRPYRTLACLFLWHSADAVPV